MAKRISDHFLVPKHEIVPKERVSEVTREYGTEIDGLPRMLKDDPIAQEIGAKHGDVIKITRKSLTAGRAIYYRVVK